MSSFSPELEEQLQKALTVLKNDKTVLIMFDDMYDVNEHFQATLDWFKAHGVSNSMRYGQGVFMQKGMVYFVGADTHIVDTRGVDEEIDLRPWSSELVRETGLAARLREKGVV